MYKIQVSIKIKTTPQTHHGALNCIAAKGIGLLYRSRSEEAGRASARKKQKQQIAKQYPSNISAKFGSPDQLPNFVGSFHGKQKSNKQSGNITKSDRQKVTYVR